ncbi:hypothetical protein HWV62_41292 [Athelia sp. TMB]|nr:hypothetical protein HWV62_41292 [Athelia sp. TMB]
MCNPKGAMLPRDARGWTPAQDRLLASAVLALDVFAQPRNRRAAAWDAVAATIPQQPRRTGTACRVRTMQLLAAHKVCAAFCAAPHGLIVFSQNGETSASQDGADEEAIGDFEETMAALAAALFDAEEGATGTSAQGKQEKFAEAQSTTTPVQISVPVNTTIEENFANPNTRNMLDDTEIPLSAPQIELGSVPAKTPSPRSYWIGLHSIEEQQKRSAPEVPPVPISHWIDLFPVDDSRESIPEIAPEPVSLFLELHPVQDASSPEAPPSPVSLSLELAPG